jgi:hypothetical protein
MPIFSEIEEGRAEKKYSSLEKQQQRRYKEIQRGYLFCDEDSKD